MPTSGCALAPRLNRRVGVRRAVLWRDEAAVEGVGSEQFQVHVREAGEDRSPSRFAQDLRENDEPQPVRSAVVRPPRWGVYVACVMSGVAYPYRGRPVVR